MPTRPPGLPLEDVADTAGIAFVPYFSLTVVVSGVSLQSLVISPIAMELRIMIELLAKRCNNARKINNVI